MTSHQTPSPMAAEQVVSYIRTLLEDGEYEAGDRLPPERELASRIGVSRPSIRAGLQTLATMGVVESRHGSGTYITANRSLLSTTQLMLLSKLHGFSDAQLFEVRRILEVDIAGLAAERATAEDLAAISEEVMEMYVNLAEPQKALIHDIRFHRALARASANPVLGALLDMVAELFYEQRKETVEHWMGGEGAVEHHRQIYQAIRDGDRSRARTEMDTHLRWAQKAQELEEFERGNR